MDKKEFVLVVQFYDASVEVHHIRDAHVNENSIDFHLKDGESRTVPFDSVYEFEVYNVRRSHLH